MYLVKYDLKVKKKKKRKQIIHEAIFLNMLTTYELKKGAKGTLT